MNAAATIALVSAALSLAVAVLARRLAGAPGSGELRWFSFVALAASTYALLNLATTLPAPPGVVVWCSRVQVAALVVHLWAWVRTSQAFLGRTPGPRERLGGRLLLAAAALPLVPGLVFGGGVVDRAYAPLGVVYRQALSTVAGDALFLVLFAVGAGVLLRFLRAALAGVRWAAALAAALGTLLAFAASDALATSFLLPLPFLLDWGFAAPILAVGWMVTSRFVEGSRALEALRAELVAQVDARSRELSTALEQLHRTEKLAALGQFANGVAHEVNNPASVVNASLRFLSEEARAPGAPPLSPDAREALADAGVAMERITALVRNLVDAGRLAVAPSGSHAAEVGQAVTKVLLLQPPAVREGVRVDGAPLRDGAVRLRADALEQVLDALVRNAADATPGGSGRGISIRAERREGTVRITVADEGAGMGPEVLRRAFDPFFTTKPHGRGAGLGLAVARGLVEGSGGRLWLESEPGRGTRAIFELPEAARPGGRGEA